jgi:hypothetical protein
MTQPVPFVFDDDPCQSAGEGITRTSEAGAQLWPCEITFACRQPMRCTIRAVSRQQAYQFAERRHPDASFITILTPKSASWL